MRRVTWVLLIIIVFLWLAIATYWTGTGSNKLKQTEFALPSQISVESPTVTLKPSPPTIATISAISATPSSSPTAEENLKY